MNPILRAAAVVATALLVVGCANGSGDDPAEADVEFARAMIPHHEQAVEMTALVDDGADASPEVRDLATRIEAAQAPEIEQMQGWLQEWDAEAPGTGDHDMAGMMSGKQMGALQDATGATFDRLWLTMMIDHHRGAVAMSEDVLSEGEDAEVATLAREVTAAQEAEITEMQELLDD
ncbi:DUF305 domain-containing protein [Aeromicrobium sp. CF4.19]|uniref:DUF305 domain-containing protein n=1 Tax=Aeromicrobium sp. CF4.19 TaxID=3373082 RepID=UPI003EE6C096